MKETKELAMTIAKATHGILKAGKVISTGLIFNVIYDDIEKAITEAEYRGRREASPDYFFNVDDWECTSNDLDYITDDLECGTVMRVGRLARLTDIFVVQRYDEEKDEYKIEEFETEAEALAWINKS